MQSPKRGEFVNPLPEGGIRKLRGKKRRGNAPYLKHRKGLRKTFWKG